ITSHYLDTWDYQSYIDNLDGVSRRVKFRLRYYDTEIPKQAHLEAKLRSGRAGYKFRHLIDNEELVAGLVGVAPEESRRKWLRQLAESPEMDEALAVNLPVLFPTAEISYNREYYESTHHPVRLTIDSGVKYRRANGTNRHFTNDPFIIC